MCGEPLNNRVIIRRLMGACKRKHLGSDCFRSAWVSPGTACHLHRHYMLVARFAMKCVSISKIEVSTKLSLPGQSVKGL